MICADTSVMIAGLAGEKGPDLELIYRAVIDRTLVLAPAIVTELLSDPGLSTDIEAYLLGIPQLEITSGYWERAGKLRAKLMRHRFKPKFADTLIAQSCLDHGVPLVTRDRDFRAFQKHAGLRILAGITPIQ